MSELLELAARVEALTGPCRETDAAIYQALNPHMEPIPNCGTGRFYDPSKISALAAQKYVTSNTATARTFTGSLDAARSLVPEGRSYQVNRTDEGGSAYVGTADEWDQHEGKAATEELALTAAALRASAGADE